MKRLAAPLVLLTLYGAVQGLYLREPMSQDGMNYFERAAAFPNINPDHFSLRIGLLLPVRAMQLLFSYSEAAYYGVPFLAAALLVLATYWLGWRLFGPAVGFGAAVLMLMNAVFLDTASLVYPDHLGTALATAGLCLVLVVAQRHEPSSRDGLAEEWTRRDHLLLMLAGALLGWAYLVREFIVFIFPVVLVIAWSYRLPWKKIAYTAAAAITVFAGELVLNTVLYNAPLKRLFVTGGHGGQRAYITDTRIDALVRLPHALAATPGAFPVLASLALLPFVALIRQRSFRIVAAWFAVFWLPITLGTGLIEPSFRLLIADKLRYWLPVFPAILVGAVAVVFRAAVFLCGRARLSARTLRWVPTILVIALASIVGVAGSADNRALVAYRVNGGTQLNQLRSWLASHGSHIDTIWTDSFTARVLPIYAHTTFGTQIWNGRVRAFEHHGKFIDTGAMTSGAVVLFQPGYSVLYRVPPQGHALVSRRDSPINGYLRHPPPGWRLVLKRRDHSLVVYRIEQVRGNRTSRSSS